MPPGDLSRDRHLKTRMESDSEEDSNFEDDFYSFLNVSRNVR